METKFKVEILQFNVIHELPKFWDDAKYRELLDIMEYGDTTDLSSQDLKEMCLMSLSDNDPENAAEIILRYLFKDELNEGQIQNLSHEMIEERMWEEYAEIDKHETFFNAHQILYDAYNGKFPNTEAVEFKLTIEASKETDLDVFNQDIEAPVLRLISKGMPENTLINRLYSDEISGNTFNEAKDILWQIERVNENNGRLEIRAISSTYWFKDLKFVDTFEGSTHQDSEDEEEEN